MFILLKDLKMVFDMQSLCHSLVTPVRLFLIQTRTEHSMFVLMGEGKERGCGEIVCHLLVTDVPNYVSGWT